MKIKRLQKEYVFLLIAALGYSGLGIFSGIMSREGMNVFSQIFWRVICALIIGFGLLIYYKVSFKLKSKEVKMLLINAVIFLFAFITISTSIYLGTPVSKAIAFSFSYPITVVALAYILNKDIPTFKNIIAIILSLISIGFLLEIWNIQNFADLQTGDLFALANSFCFGAIIVYGSKIKTSTGINPLKSLFFTLLFSLPMLIIFCFIAARLGLKVVVPELEFDLNIKEIGAILGIGFFATIVPKTVIYHAASKVKPIVMSILLPTELLWVTLFGVLFFGEILSTANKLGIIGMLLSVILV